VHSEEELLVTIRVNQLKRATGLIGVVLLTNLTVLSAQAHFRSAQDLAMSGLAMNQKQKVPPRPPLIPPKRTVSIHTIEVKLTKGSGPIGVGMSIGFGNTSSSGSESDGEIEISDPQEFSDGVRAVMMTSLSESKGFLVVDDGESSIPGGSGTTPPAGEAPAAGPGSELVLRAVITDMTCRRRSGGIAIGDLSGGQGQFENKVTMDVRLIDPLTNIVVDSVRATGRKTSKNSIFGATKYSVWDPATKILDLSYKDYEDSALAEATRLATQDAVKKLIEKSQKRPWEARVIKIIEENGELEFYLNATEDTGLRNGDELELIQQGESIIDESSGKVLGRKRDVLLGTVLVVLTDDERVICRATSKVTSHTTPNNSLVVRQKRLNNQPQSTSRVHLESHRTIF